MIRGDNVKDKEQHSGSGSYNSPVDRSYDLGEIGDISYEDVKIIVQGIIEKAKSEGVIVDSEIIYNEKTKKVDVTLTKR